MEDALLSLLKQLQQSFQVLDTEYTRYVQLLAESKAVVTEVCNLLEQYTCCQRVEVSDTPLAGFPNVKELLLAKLIALIEENMTKLQTTINDLQACQQRVSEASQKAVGTYERLSGKLPPEKMSKGENPTWPAPATLLETLSKVDAAFHTDVETKKEMARLVNYKDEGAASSLDKAWEVNKHMKSTTKADALAHTSFLVKEKL